MQEPDYSLPPWLLRETELKLPKAAAIADKTFEPEFGLAESVASGATLKAPSKTTPSKLVPSEISRIDGVVISGQSASASDLSGKKTMPPAENVTISGGSLPDGAYGRRSSGHSTNVDNANIDDPNVDNFDADGADGIELEIPQPNKRERASLAAPRFAPEMPTTLEPIGVSSGFSSRVSSALARFFRTSILVLVMLVACLTAGFLFAYLGFTLKLFG